MDPSPIHSHDCLAGRQLLEGSKKEMGFVHRSMAQQRLGEIPKNNPLANFWNQHNTNPTGDRMSAELENYIPLNHTPHARAEKDLYSDAHREMLLPMDSVKLMNFPKFNAMTGGFRPFEFSILCGATGTGKTTLCANISRDLIEQKVPHFVASVETGPLDFMKRIISAMNRTDWNTGDAISVESAKRFHENHGHHFQSNTLQLSLYDNRIKIETLLADIAWMVKHKNIKIAIIDNLNFFLEVTTAANAVIEMDRVIHE